MDIPQVLDEIATRAEQLLAMSLRGYKANLVNRILLSAKRLEELYPDLVEMMISRSRYQAVLQMSHEWRTPITALRGCVRVLPLIDGPITEEQKIILDRIEDLALQLWDWSHEGKPAE